MRVQDKTRTLPDTLIHYTGKNRYYLVSVWSDPRPLYPVPGRTGPKFRSEWFFLGPGHISPRLSTPTTDRTPGHVSWVSSNRGRGIREPLSSRSGPVADPLTSLLSKFLRPLYWEGWGWGSTSRRTVLLFDSVLPPGDPTRDVFDPRYPSRI